MSNLLKLKNSITKPSCRLATFSLLLLLLLALANGLQPAHGADLPPLASTDSAVVSSEPIVFFDLTYLYKVDLNDPHQRRRFWDEAQLVTALEGLVNREQPRLFVRFVKPQDDFWWGQMTKTNGWLTGRQIVTITNLDELLAHFRSYYNGAVVWDERVPATANLASTIAGCDDLLPLRFDPEPASFYQRYTHAPAALEVKARLLNEDGSQLFTSSGIIPGTTLPSSGSAKCDAYLWLIEKYVKPHKANPRYLGYYLDAFWLNCWKASKPENNTLCNQDFVIAKRGVLFDLGIWDDEISVDDPHQPPGTDSVTLRKLLRAEYDSLGGDGMIQVAGFVPWAYKYTDHRAKSWSAGGHHEGVATEWRYAEILSCFNAYMDADALGLSAMANASFYQHYPLQPHYEQNPKPTRQSLIEKGLLDNQGHLIPKAYVGFYVGDYDSAAWFYQSLPAMWRDPARGTVPLSWAFNPNLSERFPLGMAWSRATRTSNDWFIAGDSGAGYLNPGFLTPPRPESGLPSGLKAWEQHCDPLYRQWDISLTGFVIDGFARSLSSAGLDAYSRFSPDGMVAQHIVAQGVHNGMPFVQMRSDIDGSPAKAARLINDAARGSTPSFLVFRSILKTPTWHAQVERELHGLAGDRVKVVDLYTLMFLLREYETDAAARPISRYANVREVSARPKQTNGLEIMVNEDGQFAVEDRDGVPCWLAAKHSPPNYLYFAVDQGFRRPHARTLDLEVEYLDNGPGDLGLDYDSTDLKAGSHGAYKARHLPFPSVANPQWQTAHFHIPDARFQGSENAHADFRFYHNGGDLLIRSVRVRWLEN